MEEHEALLAAAKVSFDRIAQDRLAASPEVRRLLDQIADHLFDPGYGLRDLKRACGANAEQQLGRFGAELGRADTYIADARLATAMVLLVETDWSIARISEKVGYIEPSRFANACKRRFNISPNQYRMAAHERAPVGAQPRGTSAAGKLRAEQLSFSADRVSPVPVIESSRIAQRVAEDLQACLGRHATDKQVDLVRNKVLFGGPELFEQLSLLSRQVGRRDRDEGVRIAEVALAAVEGSRALLGERYVDLHALALARFANALRLAGDLAGAEETLENAVKSWEVPRTPVGKAIEAEILTIRGTLRLFQRRYGEARELLGTALKVSEQIDDLTWQLNARLQLAALARYEGRPAAIIADLREVTALLARQEQPDPAVVLGVCQDLAVAYLETAEIARAQAELDRAKTLCEQQGCTFIRHQLDWIAGLIAKERQELREAEALFSRARTGFNDIGDNVSGAMAALEIAMLCQDQGRTGEVLALLSREVIPVLETVEVRPEALGALTLLRQAVAKNGVSGTILEAARQALFAIRRDPSPGQQLP